MTKEISIHAPRVGCDTGLHQCLVVPIISIHAPRVGCDHRCQRTFQPAEISIHAPRVGCDHNMGCGLSTLKISIHAPRVGCDRQGVFRLLEQADFNPRTPCGVRPSGRFPPPGAGRFQSTHPVWGATTFWAVVMSWVSNFNPRTPCGVRHYPTTIRVVPS